MFECIFCLGRSFSTEKLLKHHQKGKKHTENAAAVALDTLAQTDRLSSEAAAASAASDDRKRASDAASLANKHSDSSNIN